MLPFSYLVNGIKEKFTVRRHADFLNRSRSTIKVCDFPGVTKVAEENSLADFDKCYTVTRMLLRVFNCEQKFFFATALFTSHIFFHQYKWMYLINSDIIYI